jgi:hypothetical protein
VRVRGSWRQDAKKQEEQSFGFVFASLRRNHGLMLIQAFFTLFQRIFTLFCHLASQTDHQMDVPN